MNIKVQFSRITSSRMLRVIWAGLLLLTIWMAGGGKTIQASAATATNDDFPGTSILVLPFDDLNLDVTNATTDTDPTGDNFVDPATIFGSGDCNSNQGENSVWYSYTPDINVNLSIDTIGSNYDTLVAVWQGDPNNLTLVACNDDIAIYNIQSKLEFYAHAGATYFIEVIGFVGPAVEAQSGDNKILNLHLSHGVMGSNWYGSVAITADQAVVAVGRPHISNEITTYDGFSSGGLTAYIPMLFKDAFGGSYDSALYVENLNSTYTANITIHFYNNSGTETYFMTDTVSPLASKGYWLPSIAGLGSSWVGGAVIESDQNIVAVGRPHVGSQVMTYDSFSSGSTTAYVPMLFKDAFDGSYDSALYIQNVDPSNLANITIRFYDSNGVQIHSMTDTLSPLASKGYWLPSIAGLGSSWVGGVKIESNRNIVAVGRPHVGSQVMTYDGFFSGSTTAYVPMLFKDAFDGSYDSALYIQNVDPSNLANITIRFYDSNGVQIHSMTDTLSPLASKGYWLPSIAGLGSSWVGGVKIESNRNIVAVGRPHVGSQVMTYTGFSGGTNSMYLPMLFKNMWDNYNAAFYIQNLNTTTSVNVTLRFYDVAGYLSCIRNDTISPLVSRGYWLPTLTCSP